MTTAYPNPVLNYMELIESAQKTAVSKLTHLQKKFIVNEYRQSNLGKIWCFTPSNKLTRNLTKRLVATGIGAYRPGFGHIISEYEYHLITNSL